LTLTSNLAMRRILLATSLFACATVAQAPLACFDFQGDSISSVPSALATVSDLSISNDYMFGGSASNVWLCLSTQWNNTGGTISFTVTPAPGESLNYSRFDWSAVTNNASLSDSVSAVAVTANGLVVGAVDPLTPSTTHQLDLGAVDALQGSSVPVTFVMTFVGNPTGQSAYEMGNIKLFGSQCVFAIDSVQPTQLPVVTESCFELTGDCLDQITEVKWQGISLPECTPANWGQGCYSIVDSHKIRVCPPLCEVVGNYSIELWRGGQVLTQDVNMVLSVDGALACPATHPAGTDMCIAVSSGQLPPPNAVFIIISPSNVPSIIPGFIEMGLGNMMTQYTCGAANIAECVESCYSIPAALAGQTWYFQSIVWNPFLNTLPLPVTNLCSTTFY
jgi:hypothetical protein